MIDVQELYYTVSQQANTDENGQLATSFNSFIKMAELDIMDWLTGRVDKSPSRYLTQKNKDLLIPFITSKDENFSDGTIPKPADYYTFENMRVAWLKTDCDESGKPMKWHDVTLLNSDKIANRIQSSIEGIKPTTEMPIAEIVGNEFKLHPEGMDGQSKLIYIRYPIYGIYNTVIDPIYNDNVYDPATSKNLEWEESLMNYFVDRMMQYISIRNGAVDQFQMNLQKANP